MTTWRPEHARGNESIAAARGLSGLDDPVQGRVEPAPVLAAEPPEQVRAQVAGCCLGGVEPLTAVVGEFHRAGATVVPIAPADQELLAFQVVDHAHHGGLVHAQQVDQLSLAERTTSQKGEHAEVPHRGAMTQGLAASTAVPPQVNWAVACIIVLVAEHLFALATPPYGLGVAQLFHLTFGGLYAWLAAMVHAGKGWALILLTALLATQSIGGCRSTSPRIDAMHGCSGPCWWRALSSR